VLLEKLGRVVTKPRQEIRQPPGRCMIHAQFEHSTRCLTTAGTVV